MGAIQQSSAIYLSIAEGKICRRFPQPTQNSTQRTTKEGKIVHEEHYKGWSGIIKDIQVRENDYGKQWLVSIEDDAGIAILTMPYSSGYASAFLKTLPNVDLHSSVVITPSLKIEGDKKKTSLFISQHGAALKWAFTKENPNGIPQMQKIKVKGKEQWDDSEMMDFLENMVNTTIIPKLRKNETTPVESEDEIPF